jgi:glycosyltransferase involved in cell wall biosynthesis
MIRTLQLGMGWFAEAPGGLNRVYSELLRQLPQAGVDVLGLVMGSSRVAEETDAQVRAVCAPQASLGIRWWRMRRQVGDALRADSCAVVVTHFALYAFPILDLLDDRPLVVHFHGPWALEVQREGAGLLSTALRMRLEAAVYRRSRAFIVLSKAFGRVLQERYAVDGGAIHVVPPGVDVDRYVIAGSRCQARIALGWPTERPIVLAVRRLARRMGLEDLIAATDIVRSRFPDVLVLIGGAGRLASELDATIQSCGLAHQVRLLGRIADEQLPLAYQAADLTIVPSVALEGFGLVVPESLAAGTPVLVTPVGGLPEAVEELSPHLVLSQQGATGLADGILHALDGTLPLPSADECRAFTRARYDWRAAAEGVARVYRQVLQ